MSAQLAQALKSARRLGKTNKFDEYRAALMELGRAYLAAFEAAPQQEPVAWRAKFKSEPWGPHCGCTKEHYEAVKANPGSWPGYEAEELYAAPQQAQAPKAEVCDFVQVDGLDKLPRSDAESWLRHRAGIIEACRAEGYTIVTNSQGVQLVKLGKIAAQAPGWQLVPVEPTPEMKKAAVVYANGNAVYKNVAREALEIEESIYGEVYAAMLSAAPQQGSKS